jgi:hypothetical protein
MAAPGTGQGKREALALAATAESDVRATSMQGLLARSSIAPKSCALPVPTPASCDK